MAHWSPEHRVRHAPVAAPYAGLTLLHPHPGLLCPSNALSYYPLDFFALLMAPPPACYPGFESTQASLSHPAPSLGAVCWHPSLLSTSLLRPPSSDPHHAPNLPTAFPAFRLHFNPSEAWGWITIPIVSNASSRCLH